VPQPAGEHRGHLHALRANHDVPVTMLGGDANGHKSFRRERREGRGEGRIPAERGERCGGGVLGCH
jgi:hypothetical protein